MSKTICTKYKRDNTSFYKVFKLKFRSKIKKKYSQTTSNLIFPGFKKPYSKTFTSSIWDDYKDHIRPPSDQTSIVIQYP